MKIKSASCYLSLLFLFLIWNKPSAIAQQKITDTIYYDNAWRICERSIALFYRVGILAKTDSSWFYTGKVVDYTIDDQIIMEGEYSPEGLKNGSFKFYYSNGKFSATGQYEKGKLTGTWHWYYDSGTQMAEIYFPANDQDFKFISFKNEDGTTLMENGTGKFTFNTFAFNLAGGFIVNGEYKSGLRAGKWEFCRPGDENHVVFKELYDNEGHLKKVKSDLEFYSGRTRPFEFKFYTPRLQTIENIAYNNFFRKNGDSLVAPEIFNYLAQKKATDIKLNFSNFDSGFAYIIQSLYGYSAKFNFRSKDIDEDIEFRLGFKGSPEDISVKGSGLDTTDKKFLVFLVSKFSNVQMPGTKTIAVEGYHDIYMYTIDMSPYMPGEVRNYAGNELFFSVLSRSKMLEALEEHKKDIKKYIRRILHS